MVAVDYVKIIAKVPLREADALRKAIGRAGAGQVGNYSYCSFTYTGTGRFLPHPGAKPAIGEIGQLERVEEERIEVTCERIAARAVVKAIHSTHPYEEPAIEIVQLIDEAAL